MTERNPPVWMETGVYTAEHDRLVTGLLTDRNTSSTGAFTGIEGGVVPPYDQLQVIPSGNNDMFVTIRPGIAVVPRASVEPPGAYICYNQGLATRQFDAAASASRLDLLVARVKDSTQGDTGDLWEFGIVKGAESATPVAPVVPVNAIPLAQVRITPAAQNGGVNKITASQITDRRVFVSGLGGVHLAWSTSPLPQASPGRLVYDVSNKSLLMSDGVTYDPVWGKSELLAYLAAYRPSQIYYGSLISTVAENWDRIMRDEAVDPPTAMTAPIRISNVISASGLVKVHLSTYGRVDTADRSGHMSFDVVRTDTNAVVVENATGRGPSFHSTQWSTGQITSLVSIPANVSHDFTVYGMVSTAGTRVYFRRVRMVVEPVL